MSKRTPVGLTKDAGFQIGVRKTLPVEAARLWAFLLSGEGVRLWFGDVSELPFQVSVNSPEGMEGLVTTLKEGSHLRMKWKKPGWEHFSMLQIRVIPAGKKSTISFHQDQLISESQRAEMKTHWAVVIDKVGDRIASL
ncbi:MAG: ATPase [Imperialibacter sp.]|uniref:ATPase n=1 Tax=Imperialibacter sp. TaxID=2038411 RepID=UPI0032EA9ACB